jgi:hypothetical protein
LKESVFASNLKLYQRVKTYYNGKNEVVIVWGQQEWALFLATEDAMEYYFCINLVFKIKRLVSL